MRRLLLASVSLILLVAAALAADALYPLPDGQLKLRAGSDWQPFTVQAAFGVRSVVIRHARDARVRGQVDTFGTSYAAPAARGPAAADALIQRHCGELLSAIQLGASRAKLALRKRAGLPTACEVTSRSGAIARRQVVFLTRGAEPARNLVVAHSAVWSYPAAEEGKWQPQFELLARSLLESGAAHAI